MSFRILNREDQQVYLGSGQVFGVQEVSASYQIPDVPLEFIGIRDIFPIPAGPILGQVNFSTLAIDTDPFIKCIQSGSFNGYILKDTGDISDNYSFCSGYLTNYSNACTVGQIPTLNASFKIVGDLGKIAVGNFPADATNELNKIREVPKQSPNFNVTAATNIEITLDDLSSNLVSNYNISIEVPRKDYYILGKRHAHRVEIDYPVVATIDFSIEVNNYSGQSIQSYPCKQKLKNIDLKLKNYKTNAVLTHFSFKNAVLVAESYSVSTEENVRMSAKYRCLISQLDTQNFNLNTPELTTITN